MSFFSLLERAAGRKCLERKEERAASSSLLEVGAKVGRPLLLRFDGEGVKGRLVVGVGNASVARCRRRAQRVQREVITNTTAVAGVA